MFWGTSFLRGFGEAKILDVRHFFVIFSMQNFKCNLEGAKIEKKTPTRAIIPRSSLRFGGLCGPGGKQKGWGEGNLAGILA